MQHKLVDKEKSIRLYNSARDDFLADRDVSTFTSIVNDILEAHSGKLDDFLEELYYVRAFISFCEEDYQNAIEDFDMVLKINPKNILAKKDRETAFFRNMQDYTAQNAIITSLHLFKERRLQSITV